MSSLGTSGEQAQLTELNPAGIADRTMVGVFYSQAAKYGDRPFIHHFADDHWKAETWADIQRYVLSVASALIEAGVNQGDSVIVLSENRYEWPVCDFAIQSVGGITVPIYMGTSPEVIQKIVDNSEAVVAIASNQALAGKLKVGGTLKKIVTIDVEVSTWMVRRPQQLATVAARLAAVKPDDLCTILYTSGTTGDPKGVELAHRCLVDICRAALKVFALSESDSALSFLPYSHAFERINGMFLFLMFAGQAWISRGADHLAAEIGEVQPTVMNAVPRIYEKMYAAVTARVRESPGYRRTLFHWALDVGRRHNVQKQRSTLLDAQYRLADRLVLAGLRRRLTGGRLRFFISGGAALSREIEEFFWSCGVPILNGWGMTELSSGVSSNRLDAHKFLTVGKPFPDVQVKIANDGEILVNGPGNMLGYHKNPEATEETLKDGWIYTGDIGVIDEDGFLKITDRKKALFKTAVGKYIAPQPIEFGLVQDPLIDRAVVIGEGRPYVVALIVPDWNAAKQQGLDEAALREHVQKVVDGVNSHLGNWETVKYFTLLAEDFTEAKGELSLKLDVKRKVVAQNYAKEIESMYAGKSKG